MLTMGHNQYMTSWCHHLIEFTTSYISLMKNHTNKLEEFLVHYLDVGWLSHLYTMRTNINILIQHKSSCTLFNDMACI